MYNLDAIKKDLNTFQSTSHPVDLASFGRSLPENDSNLVQALYFFQRGNQKAAFILGVAIAKKMLPLCIAVDENGNPATDQRPQKLYNLLLDYVKTGNWASMLTAQDLSMEIKTHTHDTPQQTNWSAISILKDMNDPVWTFDIVKILYLAINAFEIAKDEKGLEEFMYWLNRSFRKLMSDISHNDRARHNANVNKMIKEQGRDNASIVWCEDTRELLKNEL